MKNLFYKDIAGKAAKAGIPFLMMVLALGSPPLSAQTEEDDEDEGIYDLSPFEIDASKDTGYYAESSLAGSRLNSSLKDTPASIQVYTMEFMEDIGAVNLEDVLLYSANVEAGQGDEEAFFGGHFAQRGFVSFQARVRGLPSTRARDYFTWQLPIDIYLTERIDESRGPNALLFGIAAAGGITNQSTKRASVADNFGKVTFRTDKYGLMRGEFDYNQVLIQDKLAFRLNALHSDGDSWRSNTWNRKNAIHGGLTWRPDEKTQIRVGYESFKQDDVPGTTYVETDYLTHWTSAGSLTYDLFSDDRISQAGANGALSGKNRNTYIRSAGVTTLGTKPQVAIIEGGDPSFDGKAISLYRAMITQQYLPPTNGSGQFTTSNNIARTDSHYPYDVAFNGPGNQRSLDATDFTASIQREFAEDFYVQLDYNKWDYYWDVMPNGTGVSLRGDANEYFAGSDRTPATAIANPNAGGTFALMKNHTRWNTDRDNETIRLTSTYEFDFAERSDGGLSKLGRHRLAAGLEQLEYNSNQPVLRLSWLDAATGLNAYSTNPGGNNHAMSMRYIDLNDKSTWTGLELDNIATPVTDPLDPSRMIYADWKQTFQDAWDGNQEIESWMISTQSFFFDDRLVITAGYREDTGDNKKWLYDLTADNTEYVRTDNFLNTAWAVDNFTKGAVFHINDQFSVFYNEATNFDITSAEDVVIGSLERPGQIGFPGAGEGEDFGVMASLFDNRINVRLTRYESTQHNALNGSGAAKTMHNQLQRDLLEWWQDISFPSASADFPPLFENRVNRYTLSKASDGYELQVTANLTSNWRATFNYSYTDKEQSNVGIIENQWIDQTMEYITNVIQTWDTTTITPEWIEEGIVPSNDLEEFEAENGTIVANSFETVTNWRINTMSPGTPFGLRRNKYNFFTNYAFDEGALAGWSVGGGARYQGPNALNGRDSSGNPTKIWGESTFFADAMVRYRTNLNMFGTDTRASFQINVSNLLDARGPNIARYLRNDQSNPADRLYYLEPRSWRASASFEF
jgi:iron complex outermembrane receptor protein